MELAMKFNHLMLVSVFAVACLCGGIGLASTSQNPAKNSSSQGVYCKDEPVVPGRSPVLDTFGYRINPDRSLTFGVSVVSPQGSEFNMFGQAKQTAWGWEYHSTDPATIPGGVCKMDFKLLPGGNWAVLADPVANCTAGQGWGMSFPSYPQGTPQTYAKKNLQAANPNAMQSQDNFYKSSGQCAKETRPIKGATP
jgi:hypothetical protein